MRAVLCCVAILLVLGGRAAAQLPGQRVLPKPAGPHAVGALRFVWTDSARADRGAERGGARRVVVRVWYPTNSVAAPLARYVPEFETYARNRVLSDSMQPVVHVTRAAPPIASGSRHPLLLFSPGNGEMEHMYTSFAQEWASHGIMVAVVMSPGVSVVAFDDGTLQRRARWLYDPKPEGWDSVTRGRSVNFTRAVYDSYYDEAASYLTADLRFALDRLSREPVLREHIDTSRIIAAGHSYGGNIAVQACADDPRIRACMSLDGGAFGPLREAGLGKPFLLIRPADVNDGTPRGLAQDQLLGSMRAAALEVNIRGAEHRSFMDAHYLRAPETPALAPERVLRIVSAWSRYFLQCQVARCSGSEPGFPEVTVRRVRVAAGAAVTTSSQLE